MLNHGLWDFRMLPPTFFFGPQFSRLCHDFALDVIGLPISCCLDIWIFSVFLGGAQSLAATHEPLNSSVLATLGFPVVSTSAPRGCPKKNQFRIRQLICRLCITHFHHFAGTSTCSRYLAPCLLRKETASPIFCLV